MELEGSFSTAVPSRFLRPADDRQTIVNAKHSLLFNNGQPWEKKNSNMLFDVTMRSYDRAETSELVGCYLLAQLQEIPNIEIGL